MIFEVLTAILSLSLLIIFHELGHFFFAKKFGVTVEEFGLGIPPRIIGKKIGETIFSLNLFPFGAFVKLRGEGKKFLKDKKSFYGKSFFEKALIVLGGIFSFWLISFILFMVLIIFFGLPRVVSDEKVGKDFSIEIIAISNNSPAKEAGLKIGDKILAVSYNQETISPLLKISQLQEFVKRYSGKEISLLVKRKKKELKISAIPRKEFPEKEGPLGIVLAKIYFEKPPFYLVPFKALFFGAELTKKIVIALGKTFKQLLEGKKPEGVELVGPVGIGYFIGKSFELGVANFLLFLGNLSILLAIFNLLPLPVLDGGALLFLTIERTLKKEIPEKIEKGVNNFFFTLLILLMIFLTFRDIFRLIK